MLPGEDGDSNLVREKAATKGTDMYDCGFTENETDVALQDDDGVDLAGEDSDKQPNVGMKFKSVEEMWEYYKRYAYNMGFPVKKRNSRTFSDGELRNVTYTCGREGNRTSKSSNLLKPRPSLQTGCMARINGTVDSFGNWRITKVLLDHNHPTSPSKSRLLSCNRDISDNVKRPIVLNDTSGIPVNKTYSSTVTEAGDYENTTYTERDLRNYADKVRRLKLGAGDAAYIYAYFTKMTKQCPGFYFRVDVDEEGHLRNLFWADHRCRLAYKEFSDVISFDTTYLVNEYGMPFAPFVGVNHHGHSVLFGCGLISGEDTENFEWLFRTWLDCMDNQAPTGIVTDKDGAMRNAIATVFPNTKHRWCLRHIMKKLPEKLGYHKEKNSVFKDINKAVYESLGPADFEEKWATMLEKYDLIDNTWLANIYEERNRWVTSLLKTSFWVGIQTTQRSESMNSFFDGYVNSRTSLTRFVEQYELALRAKFEKEFQADGQSFSSLVPCVTIYEMEKQFQSTYTMKLFKEFQDQIVRTMYCDLMHCDEVDTGIMFHVREIVKLEDGKLIKKFARVLFRSSDCHVECTCHLFDFRGILCRHAIAVLIRNDVYAVPDKYILRRWRRDVSREYTRAKVYYAGLASTTSQERYDDLCREFSRLADMVADDEAECSDLKEWIASRKAGVTLNNGRSRHASNHVGHGNGQEELDTAAGPQIKDPNHVKSKDAPRRVRRKRPLENGYKKQKVSSKPKKGTQQVKEIAPCATSLTQFSEPQWHDPSHASTQMDHGAWDDHFDVEILPFDGMGIKTDLTLSPGHGIDFTEVASSSNMPRK